MFAGEIFPIKLPFESRTLLTFGSAAFAVFDPARTNTQSLKILSDELGGDVSFNKALLNASFTTSSGCRERFTRALGLISSA